MDIESILAMRSTASAAPRFGVHVAYVRFATRSKLYAAAIMYAAV